MTDHEQHPWQPIIMIIVCIAAFFAAFFILSWLMGVDLDCLFARNPAVCAQIKELTS